MSQLHAYVQLYLVAWRCQLNIRGFDPGNFEPCDRIIMLEDFPVIGTAAIEKGEQPFFIAHGSDQCERIDSGDWSSRAFRGGVSGRAARIKNIAVSDNVE